MSRSRNSLCQAHTKLHPELSLFKSYQYWQFHQPFGLTELPTVDRCFHVANANMNFASVDNVLRKLRKIYVTMIDVIIANTISTPKDEKTGTRRFLRIVDQKILIADHPPKGAIADAPTQGWWKKNANVGPHPLRVRPPR